MGQLGIAFREKDLSISKNAVAVVCNPAFTQEIALFWARQLPYLVHVFPFSKKLEASRCSHSQRMLFPSQEIPFSNLHLNTAVFWNTLKIYTQGSIQTNICNCRSQLCGRKKHGLVIRWLETRILLLTVPLSCQRFVDKSTSLPYFL